MNAADAQTTSGTRIPMRVKMEHSLITTHRQLAHQLPAIAICKRP